MEQWRQYLLEEEYEIHMMYDPASSDKKEAKTEADHNELAAKGYVHVDPEDIRKALRDEGGAAGLKAIVDRVEAEEEEVIKAMEAMKDVAQHEDGDYILDDDKKVQISETDLQEKKKKKKKKKELSPAEMKTLSYEVKKMNAIMAAIEKYDLESKFKKVIITDMGTFNAAGDNSFFFFFFFFFS